MKQVGSCSHLWPIQVLLVVRCSECKGGDNTGESSKECQTVQKTEVFDSSASSAAAPVAAEQATELST